MSTNYTGNPANVTTPISATVTNCTSGTGAKVLVTTSAAHLFATHDWVHVSGVVGTTEANGVFQITVLGSTTFLLEGSAFVNAYVSGGTAQDISLTPYFQVPDNGEACTVDSILAAVTMVADRTQWLQAHGLIGTLRTSQSGGTYGDQINAVTTGSTAWNDSNVLIQTFENCKAGDIIMVSGAAHMWIVNGAAPSVMQCRACVVDGGVDVPLLETLEQTYVHYAVSPTADIARWAWSTNYTVVNAGDITIKAQLRLSTDGGGGVVGILAEPGSLVTHLYRAKFLR